MAVDILWPGALPVPTTRGYALKPQPNVIRTDMDSGLARQRRRFTTTTTQVPVTWVMREFEYALFQGFYVYEAGEGTVWFGIPLATGIGVVVHEARFMGEVEERFLGGEVWEIVATLEVRNRPIMTLEDYELFVLIDSDALYAAIDGLEHFVNVTYPALP